MGLAQPVDARSPVSLTRRQTLAAAAALSCVASGCTTARSVSPPPRRPSIVKRQLTGMVWQPSRRALHPQGHWDWLGIRRVLVQWTAVDQLSFVANAGIPPIEAELPDWHRIAGEPWADEVIMGLAGMHDEGMARTRLVELAAQSRALRVAAERLPLRINAWYFPVEADPTWAPPPEWKAVLNELPRPLWISVYDTANLGPMALTDWIMRWVPEDVGIFFQDGVGVHARVAAVAREYLQMLSERLGRARVQVIAEAFRPAQGGGFRSATAEEFLPQLDAYQAWPIFAFDGPHYLHPALLTKLAASGVGPP